MDIITEVDGVAIDVAGMASTSSLLAGEYGPAQRTLADQARRAVLDARCSRLPMPARLLGHRQRFTLDFAP